MTGRIGAAAVLIAGLTSACSGGGSGGNGGSDGGPKPDSGGMMMMTQPDSGPMFTISVSGSAYIHPVALALYDAGLIPGPIPALPGTIVHIDEPLQVILMQADGRQGTTTLTDAGDFFVAGVDPSIVYVGLVATLVSASDDGGIDPCEAGGPGLPSWCADFATAATAVFEGYDPMMNITGSTAYGDPVAFEEYLNTQLSKLTRLGLGTVGNHLIDQGIAMGFVANSGVPMAGVSVDTRGNTDIPDIVYVGDDFSPLSPDGGAYGGTNKYGVFFVITPGMPTSYPNGFGILNHPEYGCQQVGSNPGSIFNLIFDTDNPGKCGSP